MKTIPANHIPTGTIACEGCHSITNFTAFSFTDASGTAPPAMVHSVVSSIACSTCHEAGKSFIGTPAIVVRPPPPGHVSTGECSTCHFSTTSFLGATNLPANHIPLPAADNSTCTLCHTNASDYSIYTMNHVNIAANCAQCHAAGLSFANIAPPALKETPSNHIPIGTVPCESCHSPTKFTAFSGTAMNHAAVAGVACATCHASGKSFVGAPAVVTEPGNHIPIGSVACESCHSTTTFTTFSGTAMNHANFTTNCIACHGAGLSFVGTPAVKTIPANHIPTGTIACEGCHSKTNFTAFSFTDASGTAPPAMVHSVVSSIACSTCHEAGKSFIGTPAIVVRPPPPGHVATGECSNCHLSTTSFLGATNLPANHIPLPTADNSNCALCHTNAGDYSVYTMNHANIASNCAQCHGAGLSFANIAPPALKEPPTGTPAHIPVKSNVACELCHTASKFSSFSGTIMRHAAVPGQACDSCHEYKMAWYGEPELWTRDGPNHHAGQDCGGSG
ncbi:MAG TPA: cytochrome c3 family protein, partial [Steroidobacteraceae bacterium]